MNKTALYIAAAGGALLLLMRKTRAGADSDSEGGESSFMAQGPTAQICGKIQNMSIRSLANFALETGTNLNDLIAMRKLCKAKQSGDTTGPAESVLDKAKEEADQAAQVVEDAFTYAIEAGKAAFDFLTGKGGK